MAQPQPKVHSKSEHRRDGLRWEKLRGILWGSENWYFLFLFAALASHLLGEAGLAYGHTRRCRQACRLGGLDLEGAGAHGLAHTLNAVNRETDQSTSPHFWEWVAVWPVGGQEAGTELETICNTRRGVVNSGVHACIFFGHRHSYLLDTHD